MRGTDGRVGCAALPTPRTTYCGVASRSSSTTQEVFTTTRIYMYCVQESTSRPTIATHGSDIDICYNTDHSRGFTSFKFHRTGHSRGTCSDIHDHTKLFLQSKYILYRLNNHMIYRTEIMQVHTKYVVFRSVQRVNYVNSCTTRM